MEPSPISSFRLLLLGSVPLPPPTGLAVLPQAFINFYQHMESACIVRQVLLNSNNDDYIFFECSPQARYVLSPVCGSLYPCL